jgi:hypothetical protein
MKQIAILMAVVLVLAVASAWAVGPSGPSGKAAGDKAGKGAAPAQVGPAAKKAGPADKTGPAKPADTAPLSEDQQKVAEMAAKIVAGQVDEALAEAKEFATKTLDDKAKTDALRVVADGLRKKADWKGAAQAYAKLKERFEKDSDDYVRCDAISQILNGSPAGVYGGGGAPKGEAAKTLADDEALKDALNRLVAQRAGRLKSRIGAIRIAKTPQAVVAAFKPVADEAKPLLQLGTDSGADAVKDVAEAAGKRLQEIAKQTEAALRAKLQAWQPKFDKPWTFTNLEKKEVPSIGASCKQMAATEKEFQESLMLLSGAWAGAEVVRRESSDRAALYEQLGSDFVVPPYTTRLIW